MVNNNILKLYKKAHYLCLDLKKLRSLLKNSKKISNKKFIEETKHITKNTHISSKEEALKVIDKFFNENYSICSEYLLWRKKRKSF
jgi:regulator of replication initiation timing